MATRQRETEVRVQELLTQQTELQRKLETENLELRKDVADLQAELATARLRVSFHAKLTNNFIGYGAIRPYTLVNNDGDAFNATSGVFTAPRNGTYFFMGTGGTMTSDKWVDMQLVREDGMHVALAFTQQYQGYATMGSVQATLYLSEGESVWLQSVTIKASYFYGSTSFTGFLLRAD